MTQINDVRSRYDFLQALESDDPVAVVFYGDDDDSGMLLRKIQVLADQYADRIRFVSVNAMAADLLAADWKMRPDLLPTVMLFINNHAVKTWGNEQNLEVYRNVLDAQLVQLWGA